MNISINGQDRDFTTNVSITEMLDELSLVAAKVAVERNREIVPRSLFGETTLQDGDQIEIVRFIGGG